jgi:hypothetical protein
LDVCLDEQASIARSFNAAPGVSSVDIYVNDRPRIKNIEYKELTSYFPTRPGPRNTKLYKSGSNDLLLELTNIDIPPGQIITAAIFGGSNNLQYTPIIDDINVRVSPDQVKVRFYNLDASSVAFTLTSSEVSNSLSLASGKGTEYIQVNPGDYRLQIRGTNSVSVSVSFRPGRIYTLYIIGSVDFSSPNYAQANIPQVVLAVDGNTVFSPCVWI